MKRLVCVGVLLLLSGPPRARAQPRPPGEPATRPAPPRSAARRAKPKPRVAVLILKTGAVSQELADNLTEVLIVNLAARGKYQVVGKEVVKSRLGGQEAQVLSCIGNRTCVGNVATALGLDYLIVGTLGKRQAQWMYNLYFIDAASAAERRRVHRKVTGEIPVLTKSLDAALAELLKPQVKPGTVKVVANVTGAKIHIDNQYAGSVPLVRPNLKPGRIRLRIEADGYYVAERQVMVKAGQVVVVTVKLQRIPPRRKTWKFHLAWSSFGIALGAATVAAVTGALSRRTTGTTQRQQLDDLARREKLATVANSMIAVSAAAAITSACLFIFAYKGFYRGGKERQAFFQVSPLTGGAYLSGGVRW